MKNYIVFYILVCLTFIVQLKAYPCHMVVSSSVANVMRTPGLDHADKRGPALSKNVANLDTQVTRNQQVYAFEEQEIDGVPWVKVNILEQSMVMTNDDGMFFKKIPYAGWIAKSHLANLSSDAVSTRNNSEGYQHYLESDLGNKRDDLVRHARTFIGFPYVWGGCSPFDANMPYLTGVDCSGLIHLIYRAIGLNIPRDAHDQYLASLTIRADQMKPGDLIFFGTRKQENNRTYIRMQHVMMYAGDNKIIEAYAGNPARSDVTQLTQEELVQAKVREVSIQDYLGCNLLTSSKACFIADQGRFIFFRSFFFDESI